VRYLIYLLILFTVSFFSCKNGDSSEIIDQRRNTLALFQIDSLPTVSLADVSTLVEFENRLDSLSIIREAISNSLMIQDTLYKWSHSNKCYLTYYKKENALYTNNGTYLGHMHIEANDPEVSIKTFPADNQTLLVLDAEKELVNYTPYDNGKLQKQWTLPLQNSASFLSYHFTSNEEEIILLFTKDNHKKLIVQTVDISNGEVIHTKMIEKGTLQKVHYINEKLYGLSGLSKLIVIDLLESQRDTISIGARIQNIKAYRNEETSTLYFSYKDTIFQSILHRDSTDRLLIGGNYQFGEMVKMESHLAIPYYQLNTSDQSDESNLLHSQGIFLFDITKNKVTNIKFPYRENFHKLLYLTNKLYVIYGENIFEISDFNI